MSQDYIASDCKCVVQYEITKHARKMAMASFEVPSQNLSGLRKTTKNINPSSW